MVIKTITNTNIDISEDEEEIDMCQAIDDMLMDRETIGLEKGEAIGLERGRSEGEAIGRSAEQNKLILSMFQNGIPAIQIATIVQRSLNEVESILEVR